MLAGRWLAPITVMPLCLPRMEQSGSARPTGRARIETSVAMVLAAMLLNGAKRNSLAAPLNVVFEVVYLFGRDHRAHADSRALDGGIGGRISRRQTGCRPQ
jgi:hypothetical protein